MSRRNNRQVGQSARNTRNRYSGETVLIVCEGTDTEPNYLMELKDHLRLNQASVDIVPSSGSAPISVLKHAKEAIKEAHQKGNPYSKVYCVIDKDQHLSYASAMQAVREYKNPYGAVLCVVVSVPCFEYWILMHFTPSSQIFGNGTLSPCKHLIQNALKAQIPGYQKADKSLSRTLINERLPQAIRNSKITLQNAVSAGTDNPSTKMHCLVEELQILQQYNHFPDDKKGCPIC